MERNNWSNVLSTNTCFSDIQARLELLAGVPGQIYTLVYPDGEELGADQRLVVNDNVLHGYVLK